MNELMKSDTKWSTPGGYYKLLEVNDIAVRWYSDSNSLTLNGNSSHDIKSQLRNIASLAHPEAVATSKDYKETEDAAIQIWGALHLTEIPEIVLENYYYYYLNLFKNGSPSAQIN
jgi:hypothetical protein